MNKELIKKYKIEFDHWLNGGKILMHYGKWVPVALDAKWEFFMSDLEKMGSFGYIIDDEYVEFRKALAEGKTVEFKHPQVGYKDWEIVTQEHIFQSVVLGREYRIKPEEPKFKVGDWVRVNEPTKLLPHQKEVFKVKFIDKNGNLFGEDSSTEYGNSNYFSIWQPKEGEWCWYNHLLVKVISIDKRDDGIIRYVVSAPMYAEQYSGAISLEPFLGILPSFLKDK